MAKSLEDFVNAALQHVNEVAPDQVSAMTEWQVLDVREPEEFADGHLPGAINIPRGFLEVKADLEHYKRDDRLRDRSQKLICVCGGGHRSALAARTLQEMGFENVLSVKGGWTAWTEAGLPFETGSEEK